MIAAVAAAACGSGVSGPTPDATAPPSSGSSGSDPEAPPAPAVAASPIATPSRDAVTAFVTRVPDGDSFDVRIEGDADEVRLIGLNANEGFECFGEEAGDYLRGLIEEREIQLEVSVERDDFGRLLAYAFVDGRFVNQDLVMGGWAVARDQSGHRLASDFDALESVARADGLGLWAPDACGEASPGDMRIVELMANAPGPDNENPNGEWIDIANLGDVTVDLEGWIVKDESTRHRYEFGANSEVEPGQVIRLFSGCGEDQTGERYWCKVDDAVWNNSGDTAFLLDRNGSAVDTYPYG